MNSTVSILRRAGVCILGLAGVAFCVGTGVVGAHPSWTPRMAPGSMSAEAALPFKLAFGVGPLAPEHGAASDRDDYVELLTRAGIAHFQPGQ